MLSINRFFEKGNVEIVESLIKVLNIQNFKEINKIGKLLNKLIMAPVDLKKSVDQRLKL